MPNACVLVSACVVLIVEPANGRVVALFGGLAIMLAVNVLLMRRAFAPLMRLTAMMNEVDPLRPGQRVPTDGPASEVTVLSEALNAMLDRIETERRESARRSVAAEAADRRHLAAELHDEIGQTLTALMLQLDRMAAGRPTDLALREARETAEIALEDVRTLARRLRPEVLDTLGLVPALTTLCTRLSHQTGLLIHRALPASPPDLSTDGELVVYRVAQESLTNVVRHAGATEARVTLGQRNGTVELVVEDNGVGLPAADPAGDGGVRTMRERAVLIGGQVTWRRRHEGGTAVLLRVPARDHEP